LDDSASLRPLPTGKAAPVPAAAGGTSGQAPIKKGVEMKPDQKNDDAWAEILAHAEVVVAAYDALLLASDDLAEKIARNDEYVLSQVMPRRSGERRNSHRILPWLEHYRDDIETSLAERRAAREAAEQRGALLSRLKLTKDEKRLLGIED
jgi:hypothetical protein